VVADVADFGCTHLKELCMLALCTLQELRLTVNSALLEYFAKESLIENRVF
jgi:hypothetical protein